MQGFIEFSETPDQLDCPVVGPAVAIIPDAEEVALVAAIREEHGDGASGNPPPGSGPSGVWFWDPASRTWRWDGYLV